MQPFVDIANYNRGVWVSEAITLVSVAGGVEGMSVRHGLKAGAESVRPPSHGGECGRVDSRLVRSYVLRQESRQNPTGPANGEKRVIRGGSWADLPVALSASARVAAEPGFQDRTIGFRCAMDARNRGRGEH